MTPDQQSRVTRHEFVSGLRRVLRPRTLPRDRRRRGLRAGAFQCKDDRHRPGLSDHPEVKTALQPERPSILVASRLTTTGVAATLSQTRALLVRHWWPLALVAASSRGDCGGRRSRRRSSPRWASTCGPDPTSTRSGSRSPAASTTSRTAQASGGAPQGTFSGSAPPGHHRPASTAPALGNRIAVEMNESRGVCQPTHSSCDLKPALSSTRRISLPLEVMTTTRFVGWVNSSLPGSSANAI